MVPIVSRSKCIKDYSNYRAYPHLFCAGNGAPTCHEEVGGSLAVESDQVWYVYGMARTTGCFRTGKRYNDYIRVTSFVDFILENSEGEISAGYISSGKARKCSDQNTGQMTDFLSSKQKNKNSNSPFADFRNIASDAYTVVF